MTRIKENIGQERTNQAQLGKAIEQMREYLEGPQMWFCIQSQDKEFNQRTQQGYYERIGTNTLDYWPNLLPYYQNQPDKVLILNDLKERLEKIKRNELPDYNQEIAKNMLDCLTR